jgi:hypothetical protein
MKILDKAQKSYKLLLESTLNDTGIISNIDKQSFISGFLLGHQAAIDDIVNTLIVKSEININDKFKAKVLAKPLPDEG